MRKIILGFLGSLLAVFIRTDQEALLYKRKVKTDTRLLAIVRRNAFEKYIKKRGSFVGINSEIGSVIFPHGITGIFISNGAKIGDNTVIFHQVTIGSNNLCDSKRRGAPSIGNNCYIGAGAKVIGNIVIGDNVRIGANCIVVEDIPKNSVVVNEKPRIIKKEYLMDNTFVRY